MKTKQFGGPFSKNDNWPTLNTKQEQSQGGQPTSKTKDNNTNEEQTPGVQTTSRKFQS